MPILDVELVLPAGQAVPPGLAAAIADATAAVFRTPQGQTWVRLYELSQERYSENGGGPEPVEQPVFVHVLKAAVPHGPELDEEALALATAVARACNRPVENVHVLYEPPAAGRIAFGGKFVK